MRTTKDKYINDPEFYRLVDIIGGLIREHKFTPSELREACICAAIRYEQEQLQLVDPPPISQKEIAFWHDHQKIIDSIVHPYKRKFEKQDNC